MKRATVFVLMMAMLMISPTLVAAQARGANVLIKNATVLTAINGNLAGTDILVTNGKICRPRRARRPSMRRASL
jgi:adenine deaminase